MAQRASRDYVQTEKTGSRLDANEGRFAGNGAAELLTEVDDLMRQW